MSGQQPQPERRRIFSLRLFAWRRTISPDKDRIITAEPYDCVRDCKQADGSWNDAMRSARGCTLHGLPPVERKPTAKALYQLRIGSPYMGRYPDPSLAGQSVLGIPQRPESPFEPPENGCPGAWIRSKFVDSVWPFTRRRTSGGGRVTNPKFENADWQVQEAALAYEIEEERAIAYVRNIADEKAEAARKREKDKPPRGRGR